MKWFFVDDARQSTPGRNGMRPLVAVGGLVVDATNLRALCDGLDSACAAAGFPGRPDRGAEFKWSPGRDLWMRSNLVDEARARFYASVLETAKAHDTTAIVVAVDTKAQAAHTSKSCEMDALLLVLERFHKTLGSEDGIVVCDTPSGDRADETSFLSSCLAELASGTEYVKFKQFALPVLTAASHLVRPLQVADLVTSCTLAFIAGEARFSPTTFEHIKPILRRDGSRVGGYGVKIHPDYRYGNLYHWLLGDTHFWRAGSGVPMPMNGRGYARGPDEF